MSELLDSCFSCVEKYEIIERIESIPRITRKYVECWKISTEILVDDISTPIVLYAGFNSSFPYSLPSFFFQSSQFGYFPHVDSHCGKLCLFEDGGCYKTDAPEEIVLYCIKKAKTLVREGAEKKNFSDFGAEIASYWVRSYNSEEPVIGSFVIYDKIPLSTTALNVVKCSEPLSGVTQMIPLDAILLYESNEEPFNSFMSRNFSVNRGKALFICSFQLPSEAPFDITFRDFLDKTKSEDEKRKVVSFVNHNNGGYIFFRLTKNQIGGVVILPAKFNRRGFRNGAVKTSDVYLKFERQKSKLNRLYGSLYSMTRIGERTSGTLMPEHKYAVAGLGSIGSNLVHFLNGYNNTSFTLIDYDHLTIDNIGRHLLGFQYINQLKVNAVAEHLHSIRPEQEIVAINDTCQEFMCSKICELNKHTALFVCTGDTMTDEYIINTINQGIIKIPVFFLWLEPLGAAGHLVYINRTNGEPSIKVFDSDTFLYKFNLIEDSEYNKPNKQFAKKDAGCNGTYTLYSENDVLEMLCAFYPIICKLLVTPEASKCYRWIGNIEEIAKKGITCKSDVKTLPKGTVEQFSI